MIIVQIDKYRDRYNIDIFVQDIFIFRIKKEIYIDVKPITMYSTNKIYANIKEAHKCTLYRTQTHPCTHTRTYINTGVAEFWRQITNSLKRHKYFYLVPQVHFASGTFKKGLPDKILKFLQTPLSKSCNDCPQPPLPSPPQACYAL